MDLELKLSSFDFKERMAALLQLMSKNEPVQETGRSTNMHFHSFYSYDSEGWSPLRITWEARKRGLYAAGVIEFDVIDGLDEFFYAGHMLGLRTSVGVETRSFFQRFADADIDSPGEPGVNYVIAAGFCRPLEKGTPQEAKLAEFKMRAAERNIALVARINSKLPSITVEYTKDVVPLTPSGNATERHIVTAYISKSEQVHGGSGELVKFWSGIFNMKPDEVSKLAADRPAFEEKVRSCLVKKGGIGYVQPTSDTFPPTGEFYRWAKESGTIPTEAWLDGTTGGESDTEKFLDATMSEGAEALNIIPDRNWNIKDPKTRNLKISKLREVVKAAEARHMPIIIGTEMNKKGQPFADDVGSGVLSESADVFMKGAQILVGHTILAKFADFTYSGPRAEGQFGRDIAAKNAFFAAVGALPPLTGEAASKFNALDPEKAFARIADSAKTGRW